MYECVYVYIRIDCHNTDMCLVIQPKTVSKKLYLKLMNKK